MHPLGMGLFHFGKRLAFRKSCGISMNQNDLPQGCGSPMPFFPRGAKKRIKDQPYIFGLVQNLLDIGQKAIFVLSLVLPCPFTGPKMFWAGPNFLCQTKNLFIYYGSHKHFVPDKKMIFIQ